MTSDNNMKINKKSWSTEEDAKLVKLIDELGVSGSWTMISSRMGDRSGKQCRERYHNHLKPEINKSAFTKEEDALVNELQRKLGNQWAKISKYFNGRSDNAVKNRWHIINRSKNVAELAAQKPAKKPAVPKLALHLVVPAVPRVSVVPQQAVPVNLQDFYYCHSEHNHEPTSSSRNSSGRQSGRDVAGLIKSQMRLPAQDNSLDGHSSSESYYDNEDDGADDSESDCDTWLDELLSDSHYTSSDPATSSSESEDFDQEEISQDEINYIMSSNIFAADDERNISPRVDTEHVEVGPTKAEVKVIDTFSEAALTQRDEPEEYEYAEGQEEGCNLLLPLKAEECENNGPISINTSPQVLAATTAHVVKGSGSAARLIPRKNRLFSSTTPTPVTTGIAGGGSSGDSPSHIVVSNVTLKSKNSPASVHQLKRHRGRPVGGSPQIKQQE